MKHSTSLTPCERDETQTRSLTRRRFLTDLTAGAVALGTVVNALTLSTDAEARPDAALPPAEPPAMTGAEYVAFLGGAVSPELNIQTDNDYIDPNDRWVEVAQGPLIEAIDEGSLTVCPKCLFVNYAGVPCQICEWMQVIPREEAEEYLADMEEDGSITREDLEGEMPLYRMGRAVDLLDWPDMSYFSARLLYILDYLKAVGVA